MGAIFAIIRGSFAGGASIYVYMIGAAICFAGGWTVNGWRLGEQIAAEDAAKNKALAGATANARAQDNKANDDTIQTDVNHGKRQTSIEAYAAENKRLRDELVRVRYERGSGAKPVPGKATDPGQCAGQPSPGNILLPKEEYILLLDFSGDLSREADTVNELYATCREWAFKVGRPAPSGDK